LLFLFELLVVDLC